MFTEQEIQFIKNYVVKKGYEFDIDSGGIYIDRSDEEVFFHAEICHKKEGQSLIILMDESRNIEVMIFFFYEDSYQVTNIVENCTFYLKNVKKLLSLRKEFREKFRELKFERAYLYEHDIMHNLFLNAVGLRKIKGNAIKVRELEFDKELRALVECEKCGEKMIEEDEAIFRCNNCYSNNIKVVQYGYDKEYPF